MKHFGQWWTEIMAAVLPLPVGAVAIYLFQGAGAWEAMRRWISDGMLMPPAVLLCVSVLWVLYEFQGHRATPHVKAGIVVMLAFSTIIFAASIQPPEDRALSINELFTWNVVMYALVIAACGIVAFWKARVVE